MRIAQIIGTVTLNRSVAEFRAATLKLACALSLEDLRSEDEPQGEPFVVWDDMGAGVGDRIALSEGGEAAQPFLPNHKPVDAYNAATLDRIHLAD